MKKYFGLQKVILALTTLTLVGLSSCNDQNFDWDEAHATQQYEKFTNVFIKEFGKPAEGHQWGFDVASLSLGSQLEVTSATRTAYKAEWMISQIDNRLPNNVRIYEYLGQPEIISEREHKEVYAWFSHHKVNWLNTPTYYGKDQTNITRNYNTRETVNNDNTAYFDLNLWDTKIDQNLIDWNNDGEKTPKELVYQLRNGSDGQKKYASDYLCSKGIGTELHQYLNDDGSFNLAQLKIDNETTYKNFLRESLGYGSLVDYAVNNLGDSPMGTKISFTNSWIQHIANDKQTNDEFAIDGQNRYSSANMDFMQVWDYYATDYSDASNKGNHLNDWNNAQGYGYGNQGQQNATLVVGVDNNNWTYGCSAGSSLPHDKFYIVYLKGDGYEGYYLGCDFESYGPNKNNIVPANGVCNDWIIKINNMGDITNMNPCRIMCEDLGGDGNKVTIGNTVKASDIDYNDIVIDVDNKSLSTTVTITLQAAGGTLPLAVVYDDVPLFETHAMFEKDWDWSEAKQNGTQNINYSIMYNTSLSGDSNMREAPSRTYTLYFNNTGSDGPHKKNLSAKEFELSKLHLMVYRLGLDAYLKGNSNFTQAEWVDLGNYDGIAPLKICVPTTVDWLQERVSIKEGYPNFSDWVKNPVKKFWDTKISTIDTSKLYHTGSGS